MDQQPNWMGMSFFSAPPRIKWWYYWCMFLLTPTKRVSQKETPEPDSIDYFWRFPLGTTPLVVAIFGVGKEGQPHGTSQHGRGV